MTSNDLVIVDAGLTQVKQGVSRLYDFTVQTDDTGAAAVVASACTNPQTKSLSESRLAGTVLAIQGADLIAGQGMNSALRAVDDAGLHHIAGFGTLSGASLSYDTGSSIDMDSLSLLTGLAWSTELDPGIFTAGAFFEYGNGSYDTWNSFTGASSVHGDGDAWYAGGGFLARMDFAPTGPATSTPRPAVARAACTTTTTTPICATPSDARPPMTAVPPTTACTPDSAMSGTSPKRPTSIFTASISGRIRTANP